MIAHAGRTAHPDAASFAGPIAPAHSKPMPSLHTAQFVTLLMLIAPGRGYFLFLVVTLSLILGGAVIGAVYKVAAACPDAPPHHVPVHTSRLCQRVITPRSRWRRVSPRRPPPWAAGLLWGDPRSRERACAQAAARRPTRQDAAAWCQPQANAEHPLASLLESCRGEPHAAGAASGPATPQPVQQDVLTACVRRALASPRADGCRRAFQHQRRPRILSSRARVRASQCAHGMRTVQVLSYCCPS